MRGLWCTGLMELGVHDSTSLKSLSESWRAVLVSSMFAFLDNRAREIASKFKDKNGYEIPAHA